MVHTTILLMYEVPFNILSYNVHEVILLRL